MKKIIKLAIIRDNENDPCPFGLKVNYACKNAGEIVNKMYPIESLPEDATNEDKDKIKAANKRLATWTIMMQQEQPTQCIYADDLFPEKPDKVNCSYGGPSGRDSKGMYDGIPGYSTQFAGMGLSGLSAIPFAALTENNVMKNTYYGVLSLQGKNNADKLVALAQDILKHSNNNE